MARTRDPRRRAELLTAFVQHLLERGIRDFSLRPAASALGTSPQILLYHFGSKEKLLVDAIAEVRAGERATLAHEMQQRRFGGSVSEVVWVVWRWFSGKRREPYLRLFYELYALAASRPARFKRFLDLISEDYLGVMEEGLRSWGFTRRESRAAATFYLAAFRGLLLDLLTTGERARIDAGARMLGAQLERELVARRPAQRGRHPFPSALRTGRGRRPRR